MNSPESENCKGPVTFVAVDIIHGSAPEIIIEDPSQVILGENILVADDRRYVIVDKIAAERVQVAAQRDEQHGHVNEPAGWFVVIGATCGCASLAADLVVTTTVVVVGVVAPLHFSHLGRLAAPERAVRAVPALCSSETIGDRHRNVKHFETARPVGFFCFHDDSTNDTRVHHLQIQCSFEFAFSYITQDHYTTVIITNTPDFEFRNFRIFEIRSTNENSHDFLGKIRHREKIRFLEVNYPTNEI